MFSGREFQFSTEIPVPVNISIIFQYIVNLISCLQQIKKHIKTTDLVSSNILGDLDLHICISEKPIL